MLIWAPWRPWDCIWLAHGMAAMCGWQQTSPLRGSAPGRKQGRRRGLAHWPTQVSTWPHAPLPLPLRVGWVGLTEGVLSLLPPPSPSPPPPAATGKCSCCGASHLPIVHLASCQPRLLPALLPIHWGWNCPLPGHPWGPSPHSSSAAGHGDKWVAGAGVNISCNSACLVWGGLACACPHLVRWPLSLALHIGLPLPGGAALAAQRSVMVWRCDGFHRILS